MKRIKLLTSIMMPVLCVCVLAFGIYAVTPANNQITGSITVNAANSEVDIDVYHTEVADANKIGETYTTRKGITISINDEHLNFTSEDIEGKNSYEEVESKLIIFVITNNSTTQDLGTYFSYGIPSGLDTVPTDIKRYQNLKGTDSNGDEVLDFMKATYSHYTQIPMSESASVTMSLSLLQLREEETTMSFTNNQVTLNIEKLNPAFYQGYEVVDDTLHLYSEVAFTNPDWSTIKTSASKVEIGGNIETIPMSAFASATNITEVKIFKGVKKIEYVAFAGCTNLASVNYTGGLNDWAQIEQSTMGGSALYSGAALFTSDGEVKGDIVLDTERIGEFAFFYYSKITGVTFTTKLKSVGQQAFLGCNNIQSVNYTGTLDQWMEINFDPTGNPTAYVKTLKINGEQIPENITLNMPSVGAYSLNGIETIKSVAFGASVTSIGRYAFYGCTSLSSVTFAEDSELKTLPSSAFNSCSALTSITIPKGVTIIEDHVFQGCTSLSSVTFAEGSLLESIGVNAFQDCTALTSITFSSGISLSSAFTLPTLSKENATFKGWSTEPNATTGSSVSITTVPSTITYYAIWG